MFDKMRNRVVALLASLFVGVLGAQAIQSPSHAYWVDCPAANICLWDSINYGGIPYAVTTGYIKTLPADCLILPASINNKASSVGDKTSHIGGERIVFFDLAGGGTNFGSTTPNWGDLNLGASPGVSNMNNKVSSICIL